jgi:uncharacterized phage protein (TIGR01671 family)
MREIKFRAWNKKLETMADSDNFKGALGSMLMATNYQGAEQFIFMQFTGLHDKNGKEIYEGDIIRDAFGNKTGIVSYNRYSASYEIYDYEGIHLFTDNNSIQFFEVIGNRFENPELLKEEVK